ncbi:hypothetical protein Chls_061 [Chlamydia suis]|uniref:Uncharacterized protein n=1 Tax=Chlamydia suis TaxID=83559 RepID=A0ABX6ISL5_9CHLA|nr:hypothetical protein Chls_061 [Chlamydia suis]
MKKVFCGKALFFRFFVCLGCRKIPFFLRSVANKFFLKDCLTVLSLGLGKDSLFP